jgi:hypothetical protein
VVEQADDVGAVGVEVLPLASAVEADLWAGPLDTFVAHMAEQRSRRVLADRCTEVEPEREVGELDLMRIEEVDGEASQQHEPTAQREVGDNLGQRVGHRRQRRVGGGDGGDGAAGGPGRAGDFGQLAALVVGQLDRPGRRVGDVVGVPHGRGGDRRPLGVGCAHEQQTPMASALACTSPEQHSTTLSCAGFWLNVSLSSSTV